MKAKDQQIIDSNQGSTPQDLLGLGLSPAGYSELLTSINGGARKVMEASPVPRVSENVLRPIVSQPGAHSTGGGNVRLRPAGGGVGTMVSNKTATDTMKRHPGKYVIE